MAMLINLINGMKSVILGNPSETQANPITPTKIFKTNLSQFLAMSITQKKCIANCCDGIRDLLQPEDCDLSEGSQEVIDFTFLENFNSVVDTFKFSNSTEIKSAFKQSLHEVVKEKWAAEMAKSFYPISLIQSEKEQCLQLKNGPNNIS